MIEIKDLSPKNTIISYIYTYKKEINTIYPLIPSINQIFLAYNQQ